MRKYCPKCKKTKQVTHFHKDRGSASGCQPYCKLCINNANRQRYRDDPVRYAAISKRWQAKNVESYRRYKKQQRARRFGITVKRLEELEVKANGHCQICRQKCVLHLDHCHKTKRVRGLLCSHCNKGLGQFRDNPSFLAAAITYLKTT